MTLTKSIIYSVAATAILILAFHPARSTAALDDKVKIEELLAKHLQSIGDVSVRTVKNRVATGSTRLAVLIGGAGNVAGESTMASTGQKMRFGMKFSVPEYPTEEFAFDGTRATTGLLPNGRHSNLGLFLQRENLLLKEGLIGGVLSTSWSLLRLEQQQPRIEYRGLKKVEGRQLHEVSYRPRKGPSDLKISLFFEPETFRHVRTKCRLTIAGTVGTRENPDQNPDNFHELTEDFGDFRVVDGLTLPYSYKIRLDIQDRIPLSYEYVTAIRTITHSGQIDDGVFVIK